MEPNTQNTPKPTPDYKPGPVLPPPSPNKDRHKNEGFKSILSTILILIIAPLLAIGIVRFVFQSYEVDGPSMDPTLHTHNRLIVWKTPRTWARITGNDFVPDRANIIIFIKRGMYDFNTDKEKQLIKRVIGLPGERVVVKDGVITVYNNEHPEGFQPDKTMEYGKNLNKNVSGNVDITVPPGQIFVVGDNRDNSLDSRSFGPIPVEDIVGTLSLRILPLSDFQRF